MRCAVTFRFRITSLPFGMGLERKIMMTAYGPALPLEIGKTATATCNKPDIRRFDALCVHEGKLKTMGATPFYKRTWRAVISHDNLRSACKTFSLYFQKLRRFFATLHPEGREFETLRAHHKNQEFS